MYDRFIFLGDVMLGENLLHLGRGIRTKFHERYNDLIKAIDPLISDENALLFCNLECTLGDIEDDVGPEKRIYVAEKKALKIFKIPQNTFINVANNHFCEQGPVAAKGTKIYLEEQGYNLIGKDATPAIITISDIVIKFWGVSLIEDPHYCSEYFISSYAKLLTDLGDLEKNDNELWMISVHWGDEYITKPSKQQIELGHRLVDFGFDFIIGHHPHVIQSVEYYNTGVIIYSLGNFIFDQNFSVRTQTGLIYEQSLRNKNQKMFYLSRQKGYAISKIADFSPHLYAAQNNVRYESRLRSASKKYRFLMKFEYLLNVFATDRAVLNHLISKRKE